MNTRLSHKRCTVVLLSMVMCLVAPAWADTAAADARAPLVVDTYLNALFDGDIEGLKRWLSPALLEKKAPVMDNSAYGETLRARFRNAASRIVRVVPAGSDRIKVDTQIILENGRAMDASFILVEDALGQLRIDDEAE